MEVSIIGLLVAGGLAVLGRGLGSAIVVGLFISVAFGSTAIGAIPALGGSSPQIYTLFGIALIATTVLRPNASRHIVALYRRHWLPAVTTGLAVYAVIGAIMLPRVFSGATGIFIPIQGQIFEVPLSPVPGNAAQAGYFLLGILIFLTFTMWLTRSQRWNVANAGLLAFAAINGLLGLMDLSAKIAGIVDILEPIRTGNYAFLTANVERGFWRISGGQPESSGFAVSTLAATAIGFAHWRASSCSLALCIAMLNGVLLLLSTSSTAYVAITVIVGVFLMSVLARACRGQLGVKDVAVAALFSIAVFSVALMVMMRQSTALEYLDMLDGMVIKKSASASAVERTYWNTRSIAAAFDTYGLGVGIGSSRASSWPIAVLSQLGALGAAITLSIIIAVWRLPSAIPLAIQKDGLSLKALSHAARAAALAPLVASSISGGAADPGVLFFLGSAIVVALYISQPAGPGPNRTA